MRYVRDHIHLIHLASSPYWSLVVVGKYYCSFGGFDKLRKPRMIVSTLIHKLFHNPECSHNEF